MEYNVLVDRGPSWIYVYILLYGQTAENKTTYINNTVNPV